MAEEVVLMKGNEAIAHAAIRCGADGYFGYPITPQSEVLETLAALKPWETLLFGRCRTSLSDCECNAWRSRIGNYPTQPG